MKKFPIILLSICFAIGACAQKPNYGKKITLSTNWQMQSVLEVNDNGEAISQAGYQPEEWYQVDVPTTIIAGLLANDEYDFDPLYGQNLKKIQGERFDKPWWFRKEFTLPESEKGRNVDLKLQGLNYRANIWFNGVQIANDKEVVGVFRIYHFDVTDLIDYNGANVLAIELTRPFDPNKKDGDLAIDYADWIPYPADFNGGIVNDVVLTTFDDVVIRYPLVSTRFDLPSLDVAHLTIDAEVANYSDEEQSVDIVGKINGNIEVHKEIVLKPNEKRFVTFTPEDYPELSVKNPKIWWPWQYGKQEMNQLQMSVRGDSKVYSSIKEKFGIRQVTSEIVNNNTRIFSVNGKRIMLRGGAWSPDIFLRRSAEVQEQHIKLARDLNYNIIRSEGKFEDDNFYRLCNEYGILVMSGWMCCGTWEYPENWNAEDRHVAMESERSMMYWLRNKACMMVWANGSDFPPTVQSVEEDWLAIQKELKWPNPIVATTDETVSKVSGISGLKMNGPYEWVPPIYWETDTQYGGAWSFATEISPGVSMPPYESLVKFLPEDQIWHDKPDWTYHCGTMEFANTDIFTEALDKRYGKSKNIKEYLAKAQVQNYEAHRAMFEAYGANKYEKSSGLIQWMMNNPWPSLIWHAYDYYYYPAGTYFGMKKSMELLHVQYSYATNDVSVVNSLLKKYEGLEVEAKIFDSNSKLLYSKKASIQVEEDGVAKAFTIPELEGLSKTYFLKLQLKDSEGEIISINWYWLSTKDDTIDWDTWTFYYNPQIEFADMKELSNLPLTSIEVDQYKTNSGQKIEVKNTGNHVAFFVHLRVLKGEGGDDILPVTFSDNYILLEPGESRVIECNYEMEDLGNAEAAVLASGWNLDKEKSSSATGVQIDKEF